MGAVGRGGFQTVEPSNQEDVVKEKKPGKETLPKVAKKVIRDLPASKTASSKVLGGAMRRDDPEMIP
jgi:hypothetical protein